MKGLLKLRWLLIAGILIVIGCAKQTPSVSPTSQPAASRAADYYDQVSIENGMLVFPSMEVFNTVLSELESDRLEDIVGFNETWGHLSEEEYNAKIEELGFNEDQALVAWENNYGFASLRKKISNDEAQWLAAGGEDFDNDPDNHFIVDGVFRTLLNENLEIQIGESIYLMEANRSIEITNADYETLVAIQRGADPTSFPNVKVQDFSAQRDVCDSGHHEDGFQKNNANTRRIKWVIAHNTPFLGTRHVITKVKNFRKKNGVWQGIAADSKVQVFGHVSGNDGECDEGNKFNFNTNNQQVILKAKNIQHRINVPTKTKSGWVKGYHEGIDGLTFNSELTW